jgi:CheY-like chemotaxis protein
MSFVTEQAPAMTLVDDDRHSARFMSKMLEAHGGPSPEIMENADDALELLTARAVALAPGARHLVLVDLKSSSGATRHFIAALRKTAPALDIIAMSPTLERDVRNGLIEAGAGAVFERHADVAAYRREAASIVSYWVRTQHLDAVGT